MENLPPHDFEAMESVDIGCLHGRYRVRRDLGLPLEAYDRASAEIREMSADLRG